VSAAVASAPITLQRTLPPEEAARADFYALLAAVLNNAPDGRILANLASAGPIEGDGDLSLAWQGLVDASSAMDADAAAEEYEALFAGVGKASVSIYAGFYTGAPAVDHPRVRIQQALARVGLARNEQATEPEDHFAALFETMRVLVAGAGSRPPAKLAEQKAFFEEHVGPGAARFFDALRRAPVANYYRQVAAVGAAFIALESQSLQLD
jgi:TorA maturation chaperone TorD